MFEIEDDVEIPAPSASRAPRPSKYPLRDMDPGQSFFIAIPEGQDVAKVQRSVTSSAARWKIKIISRKVEGGLRVWRKE